MGFNNMQHNQTPRLPSLHLVMVVEVDNRLANNLVTASDLEFEHPFIRAEDHSKHAVDIVRNAWPVPNCLKKIQICVGQRYLYRPNRLNACNTGE